MKFRCVASLFKVRVLGDGSLGFIQENNERISLLVLHFWAPFASPVALMHLHSESNISVASACLLKNLQR